MWKPRASDLLTTYWLLTIYYYDLLSWLWEFGTKRCLIFPCLMEQEHFGRCCKCVNTADEELCSGHCNVLNYWRLEVGASSFETLLLKTNLNHVHLLIMWQSWQESRLLTLADRIDRPMNYFHLMHICCFCYHPAKKKACLRPLTVLLTEI